MVVAYRFSPSEMEPVLVARARAGDDEAFSELMGEYGETVRRLVRRFVTDSDDASDVEQETWIRAFSRLDSLRDVHRFRPWLKSIARNSALTFVAGRSKQGAHVRTFHTYEDDEVEEFEDLSEPTPEAYTLSRDNRRKICEALGSLSQTDRDVLDMRERLRLDYDEIATRLGISRNAAEVRVCRARDRFRRIFDLVEDRQSRCGTNPLRISELIDAELDESTARDVRAHIKGCGECNERFVTMQAGQAVYRNWGGLAMPGLTGGGLLGFLAEAAQRVLGLVGLGGSAGGGAAGATTVAGATTAGGAAVATMAATSASSAGISAVVVTLIATTTIAGGAMLPVDRAPHVTEPLAATYASADVIGPSTHEAVLDARPTATPPAALAADQRLADIPSPSVADELVTTAGLASELPESQDAVETPSESDSPGAQPLAGMSEVPAATGPAVHAQNASGSGAAPASNASGTGGTSGNGRNSAPGQLKQGRADVSPSHAPGNGSTDAAVKAQGAGIARGRATETGAAKAAAGSIPVMSQNSLASTATGSAVLPGNGNNGNNGNGNNGNGNNGNGNGNGAAASAASNGGTQVNNVAGAGNNGVGHGNEGGGKGNSRGK